MMRLASGLNRRAQTMRPPSRLTTLARASRYLGRLPELFDGRSQLIVYHFMSRWDLGQGCPSCSFFADHVDGANIHLATNSVRSQIYQKNSLKTAVMTDYVSAPRAAPANIPSYGR
jgi:hypothetical protein